MSKAASLGGVAQQDLDVGRLSDGRAHVGCVVLRRGSINGTPHKVIVSITSEDGFAEESGGDF